MRTRRQMSEGGSAWRLTGRRPRLMTALVLSSMLGTWIPPLEASAQPVTPELLKRRAQNQAKGTDTESASRSTDATSKTASAPPIPTPVPGPVTPAQSAAGQSAPPPRAVGPRAGQTGRARRGAVGRQEGPAHPRQRQGELRFYRL